MQFLSPALLLGLVAATVPWLLHRIGRRRANTLRFAAMELLLRAERQVSARRRLRDVLLLVIRTAAIAALPLLFARPFAEVRSDLPVAVDIPQSAVVVLDDSASMCRRNSLIGPGTLFDVARAKARALVESMAPQSDVGLVLASEGSATPVAEPSTDRRRWLAALDAVVCSSRRGDLNTALSRGAQILQTANHPERHVYLLSDLQATGFDASAENPRGVRVAVVPLGVNDVWDNRAVVDLTSEPAPEAGAQGVAIVAEIANFSAKPALHLGLTLALDGSEVARGFVDIPPQGRVKKRFLHAFSGGGAEHQAAVQIDADRFSLDDRRLTRIEVTRGLRILVVNGDPRTVRNEDEVFFLEAALRAGGSRFQVQTALPDELGTRNIGDFAAIFLANVARPTPAASAALVRYVEGGGGLFVAVGDRVDSDVWNQRLKRILPQPLGLRRTAAARPGTAEGETVDTRQAEQLAPLDRRQPLLSGFSSANGGDGLSSARFFQYLLLEPAAGATRVIVLRYQSGAPALIESEVGRGRVLLFTSTVDREWTDLPIRPGFLPLVQESARWLSGVPSGDVAATLPVGGLREIAASPDDRRIEITKPGGGVRALVPEARDNFPGQNSDAPAAAKGRATAAARAVRFRETDEPGEYRIRAFRTNGSWVDRPEQSFLVNLDNRESDPALLSMDKRPDRVGNQATPASARAAPQRRIELWHRLGVVIIACLLIESALTLVIRSRQPAAISSR